MVRVALPYHLRTLAKVDGDVELDLGAHATPRVLIDALEARFPALRGTVRDHQTQQRRAYLRFFACGRDVSFESLDGPLPDAVVRGVEPFMVVGAISGG
ncbi:MAG TPA: MoaD/ThiS family protein [Gemmatimonadales bacterium]|jgi:hypothetical protein